MAPFDITPAGTLTTLYNFELGDGGYLLGGLVQGTDGDFYGTAYEGGANGDGNIFTVSTGLGPLVKTLPTSGKVGGAVKILGTDLTGATRVTFNGKATLFTVLSPSEISTIVPSGASTGKVRVTTPSGTLLSSGPFLVTP